MDELKVNIEIGNNFLTPNVIGNQGLTALEAIAELLANSWDWRITKKNPEQKTEIIIDLEEDSIEVIDNGVGMTRSELNTGINLAESSDEIRQKLNEKVRMGRFGMGMKVASLSLGWKFTITTISDTNPKEENVFEFDSRMLEDPKSTYLNELKIITRDKTQDSPLKDFNSGTSIKIEDLELDLPSGAALTVGMQERFSPEINYLREKDSLDFKVINEHNHEIQVGKTEIKHAFEDEILRLDFENPGKWAKRKEYKYTGHDGNEYQLRGFIQLLKQRSEKERKYGFDLWCNNQLIEGFHKSDKKDGKAVGLFSIAGRTGEKTYGVLHLDGCKPDTVKSKGFIPDESFLAIRNLIEEDLQLYKYLSVASGKASARIKDEINKRRGLGSDMPASVGSKDDKNLTTKEVVDKAREALKDKPEGTIMITDKLFVQIKKSWVFDNALDAKKNSSWETFHQKSKVHDDLIELQVYINPRSNIYKSIQEIHPFQKDQNNVISFFKKMAISESVFKLCVAEWGYSPEAARDITDEKVFPQVLKLKLD
jgi:hypothetical protein